MSTLKNKAGQKKALKEIEKAIKATRKDHKQRITIFIDGDVLDALKVEASQVGVGYQTLLNQKLRETILDDQTQLTLSSLKKEIDELKSRVLKEH